MIYVWISSITTFQPKSCTVPESLHSLVGTTEWVLLACISFKKIFKIIWHGVNSLLASLMAQWIKNSPAKQEAQGSRVQSLNGEDGNPLQYSQLKKSNRQRSLAGYSLWGCRVRYNWATKHESTLIEKTDFDSKF